MSSLRESGPLGGKRKIKVLYVAGTIRSGTTLLAQLFGEIPGFLNIAEGTYFLYRDSKAATLACSCGKLAAECDVWREIVTRIPPDACFHGSRLLRTRHFPRLWWKLRHRKQLASIQPLTSAITRTFEALLAKTGSSVIVDSSKNVSTGYLLCHIPEIELHVVHLVRHSHGIVDSWCRPDRYYRPSTLGRGLAFWCVDNTLCQLLRSRAASYSLLRYEDFVRSPRECLERIAGSVIGHPVAADLFSAARARVGSQHWLAGNPGARLNTELLVREADFRVPWPARMVANLVTFPLLLKFGYLAHKGERGGLEKIVPLQHTAAPVNPSNPVEETPRKRSSAAAG